MQPPTVQTPKIEVQQLIDNYLLPGVGQAVNHHAPLCVSAGELVGAVMLEAAQTHFMHQDADTVHSGCAAAA